MNLPLAMMTRSENAWGLVECTILALLISPAWGGCKTSNGGVAPATGGSSGSGGTTSSGGMTGSGGTTGSGVGAMGAAGARGGASGEMGGTAGGTPGRGGDRGTGGAGTGGGTANGGGMGSMGSAGSVGSVGSCPSVADFATWPSGKGPLDIGRLATTDFKSHTSDTYGGAGYSLVFSWFGALRFTRITGDAPNNAALITAFEPYATGAITVDNSATATVDYRAFGDLPLEIYLQNSDTRCLTLGLARADAQWQTPNANGISSDARTWADDMFMITGLQVAAYRATKDTKYLDRAAKTMLSYFTALQQPDGLFWHTQTSKAYWGRANGWVASGMTELLLELPSGATRDSVMAGFKKQMDGLLPLQVSGGTDDGAWRQVLDLPSAPVETSCTAMFTYALVNAVKNGWLTDAKYAAAARRGWLAVANKTNGSGKLDKVCPGTGAAPAGTLASQQSFYATIALGLGDLHGQAPLLWSAAALLRTDCPGVR